MACQWKDLGTWDIKAALAARFNATFSSFVPFGNHAEEVVESVDPRSEPDKLWPVYGVNNQDGVFFSHWQRGTDFNASYRRIRKDWFFHNPTRANVGSLGRVPNVEEDAITSPEYQVWRVNDPTWTTDFAEVLIQLPFFRELIQVHRVGAVKQRLYARNLLAIPVPNLSTAEQTEVVDRWARRQAEATHAEAEAHRIECEAAASFLHSLGLNIPDAQKTGRVFARDWSQIERWGFGVNQPAVDLDVHRSSYPVITLDHAIADLENGWSPKCLDRPAVDGEWGVLKMGAVSFGRYDTHENKALPITLQPIPRLEVRAGDWLVSRANITRLVGACALVGETQSKLMLCDKIFRAIWREPSPIHPAYLDAVLKTPHLRHQIEHRLTGSSPTMKNISKPALLNLELPLPPTSVQAELVARLAEAHQQADALRAQASRKRDQAKTEAEAMILGTMSPSKR